MKIVEFPILGSLSLSTTQIGLCDLGRLFDNIASPYQSQTAESTMALSKKQRHQLKLSQKRRERRPEPTITIAPSMDVKNSDRSRLTQSNPKLMLSLETLLVQETQRDELVDDATLATALRCAVQSKEPCSETIAAVVDSLNRWQFAQDDAQATQLAMRVIHESIQTRSDCQPGSRSYISFAASFVKDAPRATSRISS